MRRAGVFALAAFLLYAGGEALRIWALARRSRTLPAAAEGEHRVGQGSVFRLTVMGDSLGAGYGASGFDASIAGRVARYLANDLPAAPRQVVVRVVAEKGAKMRAVLGQPLPDPRQDLILVIAGSNDLFRLTGAEDLRRSTAEVLQRLAAHADRVAVVGPGVVGDAGLVPWLARPLYHLLRPRYVAAMRAAAAANPAAIYVDPAVGAAEGAGDYGDTVSEVDRFHLSDEGHRWWADRAIDGLRSLR